MARELSVGQVAERSGLAVSALHFYEARGLISSNRTGGNQRRYHKDVLRRLGIIKVGQELGISLAEIKAALASLPEDKPAKLKDWQKVSRGWAADLDRRIARLQLLREGLTGCIGCGCLSVDSCGLLNPQDRLSQAGAGPQRLEV